MNSGREGFTIIEMTVLLVFLAALSASLTVCDRPQISKPVGELLDCPPPKEWKGRYYYRTKQSVAFRAAFKETGEQFTGEIFEMTRARPQDIQDTELHSTVTGTIRNGSMTFTKKYDGTGGWSHSVQYSGDFTSEGGLASVKGNWALSGETGQFDMRCE
jgi:hypothetical protein